MYMTDIALYRDTGLEVYEKVHYSHGEHLREVDAILSWYKRGNSRILDIGCSGGLHALEMAKRGHIVTGIDIEPAAIELARKRNQDLHLKAGFLVIDLEKGPLSALGKFEMVYSIGNVLSHLQKKSVPELLGKIKDCLLEDGIFLFDVLHVGEEFPEEVYEEDLGITWKRNLDRETGKIRLQGDFRDYGFIQDFQVWGYGRYEMLAILKRAGFCHVDISASLDFPRVQRIPGNPICLRYRARTKERE
jgi:SAM-dependent methyltransferase